jgi:putative SOS response-associated peptidase YedK
MAPIHDRMPVILQPEQFDAWLDTSNNNIEALKTMLLPCQPDQMHAYPVSTSINRWNVDGPACIELMETQ